MNMKIKYSMAFLCLSLMVGCKKDIPAVPVPQTKAVTGQEAPCENLTWGGFPRIVADRNMATSFVCRHAYALNFNGTRGTSDWVVEKISEPGGDFEDQFRADPELPESLQTTPEDYLGIGYQKGFLADPKNTSFQSDQSHAFYLSNVFPQHPEQAATWQMIQKWAQSQALKKKGVFAITGVVYKDGDGLGWVGVGGENSSGNQGKVQVPTSVFKIVVHPESRSVMAFMVPNGPEAKGSLNTFVVSVNDIENQTGLVFFPDWPENEQKALKLRSSWR